ncbi:MAG: photosystem II protein PsbQ [Oscillatoriales cyanobacterium]|nr:MAG: photosystem II protein PsbQ [Oscillatoriales cyanobacterium]
MIQLRSALLALVMVATIAFAGLGFAPAAQAETYTSAQKAQIEIFVPSVQDLRDQLPEIESYIANKRWREIQTFVHGPLGELRERLSRVSRRLKGSDRTTAEAAAKDLFKHLVAMDEFAGQFDYKRAGNEYLAAVKAFDQFLSVVPQ